MEDMFQIYQPATNISALPPTPVYNNVIVIDYNERQNLFFSDFFGGQMLVFKNMPNSSVTFTLPSDSILLQLFYSPQPGSTHSWNLDIGDATTLYLQSDHSNVPFATKGVNNLVMEVAVASPTSPVIYLQNNTGGNVGLGATGPTGPSGISSLDTKAYYGYFYDIINQHASGTNIPTPVLLRTTSSATGFSLVNNSQITAENTGMYNLQFSANFYSASTGDIEKIWIRQNNSDVSNSFRTTQGSEQNIVQAWNWFVNMAPTDYVEIFWETSGTSYLKQYTDNPSIIASVFQITNTGDGPAGEQGPTGPTGPTGVFSDGISWGDYVIWNGSDWVSAITELGESRIILGDQAGQTSQGTGSIAIGYQAGQTSQGAASIAIGYQAGQNRQGTGSVAVGYQAGQNDQGTGSVAVGYQAGMTGQKAYSVCVGYQAGGINQGMNALAVGYQAGYSSQQPNALAIGYQAGQFNQGDFSIALGYQSGINNQQINCISIGYASGAWTQQEGAIAIGTQAGSFIQATSSVAIGYRAGYSTQGINSVAIGYQAGYDSQGSGSIAIGYEAGYSQRESCVAIGYRAGYTQAKNSIILCASTGGLSSYTGGFYVFPVRQETGITGLVQYNSATKEITYNDLASGIQAPSLSFVSDSSIVMTSPNVSINVDTIGIRYSGESTYSGYTGTVLGSFGKVVYDSVLISPSSFADFVLQLGVYSLGNPMVTLVPVYSANNAIPVVSTVSVSSDVSFRVFNLGADSIVSLPIEYLIINSL